MNEINYQQPTRLVEDYAVCKHTGEVLGQYVVSDVIGADHPDAVTPTASKSRTLDYEQYVQTMMAPENAAQLQLDALKAADALKKITEPRTPKVYETGEQSTEKKRGRPKAVVLNPIAPLMMVLDVHRFQWMDDIVFGSTLTSAGTNPTSNKPNCSIAAVYSALRMPVISAHNVMNEGDSTRKCQYIVKAARHAIHGICSYLLNHPALLAQLHDELNIERGFLGLDFYFLTPDAVPATDYKDDCTNVPAPVAQSIEYTCKCCGEVALIAQVCGLCRQEHGVGYGQQIGKLKPVVPTCAKEHDYDMADDLVKDLSAEIQTVV